MMMMMIMIIIQCGQTLIIVFHVSPMKWPYFVSPRNDPDVNTGVENLPLATPRDW
jgi:hypothetical protein